MDALLTTTELAEVWKVSEKTIYNFRKSGMPYKMIGRSVRFEEEAVNNWMNQRKQKEERGQ